MMVITIDEKITKLIQICKKTGNFKKISIAGFILVSNQVDEIGCRLLLRARKKRDGETLIQYLQFINNMLEKSININLIREELIDKVAIVEDLFITTKGNIPKSYLPSLFAIYYELKKLRIPHLFENRTTDQFFDNGALKLSSYLSDGVGKKQKNLDLLKTMMLQKITSQEKKLKNQLNKEYHPEILEKVIQMNALKTSLQKGNKNAITVKGKLKDNLHYRHTLQRSPGYLLLAVCIILLVLGSITILETIMYPELLNSLNFMILLCFAPALFIFYLYYKNYIKS